MYTSKRYKFKALMHDICCTLIYKCRRLALDMNIHTCTEERLHVKIYMFGTIIILTTTICIKYTSLRNYSILYSPCGKILTTKTCTKYTSLGICSIL